MKEDLKILTISESELEDIIDSIKTVISEILSEHYYNLVFDIDQKTIYEQLAQIEEILILKESILNGVTDTYNNFLKSKIESEIALERIQRVRKETIKNMEFDIKKTSITTLAITLLIPSISPIAIVCSIPIIGADYYLKRVSAEFIEYSKSLIEGYQKPHKDFYGFTSTLRDDYHASKRKLEELKKRALLGEDITDELIKIINPENIGLQKTPISFQFDDIFNDIEEEPIQYQKK